MSTKNSNTTSATATNFAELFAEMENKSSKGTKEIYNYNGKEIAAIFDRVGDKKKARSIFRKKVEIYAYNIAQLATMEQKKGVAKEFWKKFSDCFTSKTIASNLRANKFVDELQSLINAL